MAECEVLDIGEKPNYADLKKLFSDEINKRKIDREKYEFEWE